uniref:Reverse transcriptase domain-containing protein n=1 Tax=Sinocyclocheilus anshuiensis TaxID=1608454 RepID=A0A671SSB9_9TELE
MSLVDGLLLNHVTNDFAKAFDAVDHTVAVKCLLDLGVRPSLIPWICNFMSNRRQRVRYQGYLSDWEYPSCGVAQGTILGPIIFLALINNALQDQIAHWKYVDDMTMAESSLSTDQIKRLESVQKRVCKIILGQRYQGYSDALSLLGLCTLAERRVQQFLDFARKLYKSSFRNWLPPLREHPPWIVHTSRETSPTVS